MRKLKDYFLYSRYCFFLFKNKRLSSLLSSLKIVNGEETIDYIIKSRCSVSRYGDGEFAVMTGGENGFQTIDSTLATRLCEIISTPLKNHIVCIPRVIKKQRGLKFSSKLFILGLLSERGNTMFYPFLKTGRVYYDAYFTRFYMPYRNPQNIESYINVLKQIWNNKDICIIEGKYSRLGVNNNLFSNANSIVRVICPAQNAFDLYTKILESSRIYGKNRLVLIALGMTATVLAYDLAKEGFQAIDIGHIDVEYMWYKMGAKSKVPIPGRYVNECGGIKEELEESLLNEYKAQIVSVID